MNQILKSKSCKKDPGPFPTATEDLIRKAMENSTIEIVTFFKPEIGISIMGYWSNDKKSIVRSSPVLQIWSLDWVIPDSGVRGWWLVRTTNNHLWIVKVVVREM